MRFEPRWQYHALLRFVRPKGHGLECGAFSIFDGIDALRHKGYSQRMNITQLHVGMKIKFTVSRGYYRPNVVYVVKALSANEAWIASSQGMTTVNRFDLAFAELWIDAELIRSLRY